MEEFGFVKEWSIDSAAPNGGDHNAETLRVAEAIGQERVSSRVPRARFVQYRRCCECVDIEPIYVISI